MPVLYGFGASAVLVIVWRDKISFEGLTELLGGICAGIVNLAPSAKKSLTPNSYATHMHVRGFICKERYLHMQPFPNRKVGVWIWSLRGRGGGGV